LNDSISPASDWISRALARPGQSRWADVPGNRIHYLEWDGPPDRPGILLVHGFRAHAHWWDFVAPWLAEDFRVLAMDLGGMGDSGRRANYSFNLFAEEIAGVLAHAQLREATLVGHSFGGSVSIDACYRFPELMRRAVIIDSRVNFADDEMRSFDAPMRPKKRYASAAAALQHFRLVPDQGGVPAPIFTHIAQHSLKEENGAWVWKFDDACWAPELPPPVLTDGAMLARLPLPIDFICGEHSVAVPPALARRIGASLQRGRGPIVIPDAHHHVLLDQPLALTAVLRALLA
jgi:pimeloyl-ACP methyl ester carboxylesterase